MPNYNTKLITARRSYSVGEIATLLGINRRTCGRWVKYESLKPIEENTSPLLITGYDLIQFIKKKREERRIPLKENEFFCVKCHKAVRAKPETEKTVKTGKRTGKDNREQLRKIGACEICQTKLFKFLGVSQRD
jgi:hypothetical protein